MEPIRVLIVDDHAVVRQGLRSLLSVHEDILVVGEADRGAVVLKQVAELQPDVVLLDIRIPPPSGIDVAHRLRRTYPEVKVIILTTYDDDEYLSDALRVGAHAYLLKDVSRKSLVDSIRQVYHGRRLLSPGLVDRVLRSYEAMAKKAARYEYDLTEEDLLVLREISEGATTKDIARKIHLSEATVKKRVQDILDKMGVAHRTQAVAKAIREGLI